MGIAKSIKISHVFGTCKLVKTPPKLWVRKIMGPV